MKTLEKRVALVTGSSSGIGQAIAVRLAQSGANVVVNYSGNPKGAEETLARSKRPTPGASSSKLMCRRSLRPTR